MSIQHNVESVNCLVIQKSSPPIWTGMRRPAPIAVWRKFRLVSAVSCDWP